MTSLRSGLRPIYDSDRRSYRLQLTRLSDTAAYGAAILAAKIRAEVTLQREFCKLKTYVLARLEITAQGEVINWVETSELNSINHEVVIS
ncbi:unnamed protein product [Protopolystoma xenopodis]|uniref:Uncharacterized protein n=1 Tax=Protopolystoma xenopodis TaxID=117903 RepID=A0A448WSL9_9PLAT|nr:unnamed protein product [Protopolystoma xenopodis]